MKPGLYDDLLTGDSAGGGLYEDLTATPAPSPLANDGHFDDWEKMQAYLKPLGWKVTSGKRKNLNPGSLHAAGKALDAVHPNMWDDAWLEAHAMEMAKYGVQVVDERYGPAGPGLRHTGAHIHYEYDPEGASRGFKLQKRSVMGMPKAKAHPSMAKYDAEGDKKRNERQRVIKEIQRLVPKIGEASPKVKELRKKLYVLDSQLGNNPTPATAGAMVGAATGQRQVAGGTDPSSMLSTLVGLAPQMVPSDAGSAGWFPAPTQEQPNPALLGAMVGATKPEPKKPAKKAKEAKKVRGTFDGLPFTEADYQDALDKGLGVVPLKHDRTKYLPLKSAMNYVASRTGNVVARGTMTPEAAQSKAIVEDAPIGRGKRRADAPESVSDALQKRYQQYTKLSKDDAPYAYKALEMLGGVIDPVGSTAAMVSQVADDPKGAAVETVRGLNFLEPGIEGPERFGRAVNAIFALAGAKVGVDAAKGAATLKKARKIVETQRPPEVTNAFVDSVLAKADQLQKEIAVREFGDKEPGVQFRKPVEKAVDTPSDNRATVQPPATKDADVVTQPKAAPVEPKAKDDLTQIQGEEWRQRKDARLARIADRDGKGQAKKYETFLARFNSEKGYANADHADYRSSGIVTKEKDGRYLLHVLADTDSPAAKWRVHSTIDVSDQFAPAVPAEVLADYPDLASKYGVDAPVESPVAPKVEPPAAKDADVVTPTKTSVEAPEPKPVATAVQAPEPKAQSPANSTDTPRLSILKESLAKKQAAFDKKLAEHMGDVRAANGQPLNDKRNGPATVRRWEQQNQSLRTLDEEIKKTQRAIEIEEGKIARVQAVGVPEPLREMVDSGELVQWRKHPNTFFVKGVDKGRIVIDPEKGTIGVRYLDAVSKEHYPAFRDAVNKARRRLAGE